jgi:hypothetical protein
LSCDGDAGEVFRIAAEVALRFIDAGGGRGVELVVAGDPEDVLEVLGGAAEGFDGVFDCFAD